MNKEQDKPRILIVAPMEEEGLLALSEEFEIDVKIGITKENLLSIIGSYDGIFTRRVCPIHEEVITKGNKLKFIATGGAGLDHIDVNFAEKKEISIIRSLGVNSSSVAELTIGLIININRYITTFNNEVRQGEWNKYHRFGSRLAEKSIGVIGFGLIGQKVSNIAKAMGMKVLIFDPFYKEENNEVIKMSLDELLKSADIVTIHVPYTADTNNLISKRELSLMKKGSCIVNTSRGEIINETDLYESLHSGHLVGAALDVLQDEPRGAGKTPNSLLLTLENVIVTPHIGAWTKDAQLEASLTIARQMIQKINKSEVS